MCENHTSIGSVRTQEVFSQIRENPLLWFAMGSPTAFGKALEAAISAAGMSKNRFAQTVGHGSGFLTMVIQGKRTPPLDNLTLWVDILGIEDKARFQELACIAHLPEHVQPLFVAHMERRYYLEAERLKIDSRRAAEPESPYRGET